MMGSTQEAIQASASPAGSEPGRTSRAYMAYWEAKLLVPTATPERHSSQPTAFSGRREATMAPTVASITTSAFPSHQSKTCAFGSERLRTKRRRLSTLQQNYGDVNGLALVGHRRHDLRLQPRQCNPKIRHRNSVPEHLAVIAARYT